MPKKTLTGEIDEAAHRAWHAFADEHSTSVAKLLEVIGENIDAVLGGEHLADLWLEADRRTSQGRRAGGPRRRST